MLLKHAEFTSESSSGHTLIILHGLFGSMRNWQTISRRLAADFRVITVDQRNHGESPHSDRMDYQAMADDIHELMDSLQIETAHILGHSMGGKVSMVLSLIYPDIVDSLTVVDIAPANYRHGFESLVEALQKLPLQSLNNRRDADEWLASRIPAASLRQFLLQNLVKSDAGFSWRVNLPVIAENISRISEFPAHQGEISYDGPCIFIGGGDSQYIREEHRPAMGNLFPAHELHYIAGAGHWPHVENAAGFFEILDPFLAKHRA